MGEDLSYITSGIQKDFGHTMLFTVIMEDFG